MRISMYLWSAVRKPFLQADELKELSPKLSKREHALVIESNRFCGSACSNADGPSARYGRPERASNARACFWIIRNTLVFHREGGCCHSAGRCRWMENS